MGDITLSNINFLIKKFIINKYMYAGSVNSSFYIMQQAMNSHQVMKVSSHAMKEECIAVMKAQEVCFYKKVANQ